MAQTNPADNDPNIPQDSFLQTNNFENNTQEFNNFQQQQDPKKVTKIKIDVSLEDLYSGCIKQLNFKKNNNQHTKVEFAIYPYYANGTQILVNAERNRDLIVELCEKPHQR